MNDQVRVLVVDDSAYNRRTIIKMLETIPGVEVVGYAVNGEEGLRKVFDLKPDLITLDLEMPRMDGFSFLRVVMQNRPTPVIVVSARSEDENVFRALEFGAVEFVAKPSARVSPELFSIQEDLLQKVRTIARTDMKKVLNRPAPGTAGPLRQAAKIRAADGEQINQVVIAASTGGPPALQAILSAIREPIPLGIAIAQHMPPGFTKAFADRLNKYCPLEIREARSGDRMRPGTVLVAPGAKNLLFRRRGDEVLAEVVEPAANQRYTPSADVLFTSASEIFGSRLLGVVLTGMGNDGARGVVSIKEEGGAVLAEAESSSVVFGMPKEAIATGKVDKIVPLPQMGGAILHRCGFGRYSA
ncbi:chemotaxis response regulator protein-glutamate methylesterase [Desulfuromonas sp. TF]|uniref:protein-glutamate methylesterase/protein-glutamine glutaminase n=1 Tax=Desulfuromonas sp. TF TaxID=1232410 RepID=UPI0004837472